MIDVINTEDGSVTLFNAEVGEHYHSVHGARAESKHIFINAGFAACEKAERVVLEIGFGTGLNALLTAIEAVRSEVKVVYHTIELYPIEGEVVDVVVESAPMSERGIVRALHECRWGEVVEINEWFSIVKHRGNIVDWDYSGMGADVVYFDAFSPEKQPELWSEEVFGKVYGGMNVGGVLTTYCAKGVVRRAMQAVGFEVERLAGPVGKRHITRGRKV